MSRLRAGRSIGVLRSEMAKKGLKIGTETLHRAIKGEAGNRLESLEKIAEFFETTVDQLLQFDGVNETYWPFSAELQRIVLRLQEEELIRAENVLRAHLGLAQILASDFANVKQIPSSEPNPPPYADPFKEDGAGPMHQAELPPPKRNARKSNTGPARKKGRRRT